MKCSSHQVLLEHPHPEYFTTSQWRWPPVVYVLYRVVAALYLLVWLVLSGVLGSDGSRWFLYLTNWTFLLLNLQAVVMAATAVHAYIATRNAVTHLDGGCTQKMPWYLKAQWVIYNMATTGSLIVSAGYWVLLWESQLGLSVTEFHVHGYNSLYVILDLFITATPVRLLHVWHPLLYGALYLVFTLLYTGLGGTNAAGNNYIYATLDFYSTPRTAVMYALLTLLLGVPVTWLFVYRMAGIRLFHSKRVGCRCSHSYPPDELEVLIQVGRSVKEAMREGKRQVQEKQLPEKERWAEEEENEARKGTRSSDEGRQSVVFVTDSSGGHDNMAFITKL